MSTHLAAAIQMATSNDKAANLEKAEHLIRLAAARGAKLVGLPEVFNWRGKRSDEAEAAEGLDGATLTLMGRLARELEIHLLAGSITEHAPGEEKRYNTSVLLGPDGKQLASTARSICSTSTCPDASRSGNQMGRSRAVRS